MMARSWEYLFSLQVSYFLLNKRTNELLSHGFYLYIQLEAQEIKILHLFLTYLFMNFEMLCLMERLWFQATVLWSIK